MPANGSTADRSTAELERFLTERAVLVLRYWEQLTDSETAALLGCAEGSVKSAGSRGLARLRELADDWNDSAALCGPNGKRS